MDKIITGRKMQVDAIAAIIEEHLICDCGEWAEDMGEACLHIAAKVVEYLEARNG